MAESLSYVITSDRLFLCMCLAVVILSVEKELKGDI